jgi:quercetin dioxygenase-like cupin family protein
MQKIAAAVVLPLSLIVGSSLPVSAQRGTAQPQASPDPGVNPVRLLDRDEIRVTRVELAAGAVRSMHAHDDVAYHVWAPVAGTLEITIEKGTPTKAQPGQAFFMKKGTQHWFRNTGTTPAAVMEIFVKSSTAAAAAGADVESAVALALAGLQFR